MKLSHRTRRIISVLAILTLAGIWLAVNPTSYESNPIPTEQATDSQKTTSEQNLDSNQGQTKLAKDVLEQLEIKGRAPKTGYARTEFYKSWPNVDGCSLRQIIIKRELGDSAVLDGCDVISGTFTEPYTGSVMTFYQKSDISKKIQIDHIVALSDAWQKGAQQWDEETRRNFANDPRNLRAVKGRLNAQKGAGDAATWLPPQRQHRCEYARDIIDVKSEYGLWVTPAEKDALHTQLSTCTN